MNKKIFGKATALSLAAVTALSAFAMTVSADVTYSIQDQTITGTAILATASMSYKTVTYTASPVVGSNGKVTVSFPSVVGNAPQIVEETDQITYDDYGHYAMLSQANNVYFASSTAANSALTKIKNAASYQNTYAKYTSAGVVVGGTNALAEWKKSWTDYQADYNNTYTTTYNTTYTAEVQNGTAAADAVVIANTAAAAAAQALAAPTETGFVQMTYTAVTNTSSVNMTTLKNKFGEKVNVNNLTGAITAGADWTINTKGGSNTDDPTTPGTSSNTWYPALSAYRKPTTSGLSYQGYNGFWYTSQAAADYYGDGFSGITKTSNYTATSGADIYFSAADGYYYASSALANTAYCYQVASGTYSSSYGSYRAANGYYYPTVSAAQNASYAYNRTTTYTTYATTASARYFSMVTGKCYDTAAAAQAAAPSYSSSYVIDLATYTGTTTNDIYNIYDPYYYYYMMGGNGGFGTTKIDPDAPAIYGSAKKSGWSRIVSVVKTTAKGKTVTIDMNASTVVPDDVLVAAKSKGVNLKFVLANGATWTMKAADIKSTDTMNIDVEYNTKNIKSSLVSKAKKLNPGAVSTAQISVNGSVDVNAGLTVKLSSKRAGCTVKAYIKTSSGSLKLVDKGVVNSNGSVTLDVNKGGDYLLVVID